MSIAKSTLNYEILFNEFLVGQSGTSFIIDTFIVPGVPDVSYECLYSINYYC